MGQDYSLPADFVTQFDTDEIKRLGKRFRKLDKDHSGTLSMDEIMSIPGLKENPLVERVMQVFDTDGNKELDFTEFLAGISNFASEDKSAKLKFIFQFYDINGDGFISNGELFSVLQMMVGDNLNEVQLQQVVDKTIQQFDRDGDEKISYDEFCSAVDDDLDVLDVFKKMSVNV